MSLSRCTSVVASEGLLRLSMYSPKYHGAVHAVWEPHDVVASGEVITAYPIHLGLVDFGLGLVLELGLLLGLLHGRRRANPGLENTDLAGPKLRVWCSLFGSNTRFLLA